MLPCCLYVLWRARIAAADLLTSLKPIHLLFLFSSLKLPQTPFLRVVLRTIAAKTPASATSSKQKSSKSKTKDRSSSSTPEDDSNVADNNSPVRDETTIGGGSHEDDFGDVEESVPVVEPKTPKSRKSKKVTGSKADGDGGGNKKGKNGGAGVSS